MNICLSNIGVTTPVGFAIWHVRNELFFWLRSQLKALLTAHLQLACHLQASFFPHSPVNGVVASTYMQHTFKFSLREGTLGSQVPQLVWHHVSISQFSQRSVRAVDTPVPTEVICNSFYGHRKKGILCSSSRNVVTPVCPQAKKSFASLLLFSEGAGIVKIKADLKGNQSKCWWCHCLENTVSSRFYFPGKETSPLPFCIRLNVLLSAKTV